MKIGKYEISSNWIILAGMIIGVIIIFTILSLKSCQKPLDNTAVIAAMKDALEKEYTAKLTTKDDIIDSKEKENTALRSKIAVSKENYAVLSKKYNDLKKEAFTDVILPKTDKEMRDRYAIVGFTPAPAGVCGAGYICFSTGYK
jgi:hypothetical protein